MNRIPSIAAIVFLLHFPVICKGAESDLNLSIEIPHWANATPVLSWGAAVPRFHVILANKASVDKRIFQDWCS